MATAEYNAYISSPYWHRKRNKCLSRDEDRCRCCGTDTKLQVHHKTYDRFGDEELDDLVTVCDSCHMKIHNEFTRRMTAGYGTTLAKVTDSVIMKQQVRKKKYLPRPPATPIESNPQVVALFKDAVQDYFENFGGPSGMF